MLLWQRASAISGRENNCRRGKLFFEDVLGGGAGGGGLISLFATHGVLLTLLAREGHPLAPADLLAAAVVEDGFDDWTARSVGSARDLGQAGAGARDRLLNFPHGGPSFIEVGHGFFRYVRCGKVGAERIGLSVNGSTGLSGRGNFLSTFRLCNFELEWL
jgi:hypothetical protein